MKENKNLRTSCGCAVITGASQGLGLEFAKLFAKDKYDLILVARSADKLAKIKSDIEKSYGVTVYNCVQDLTEEKAATAVYDYAKENGLTVTALVNNAGFGDFGEYVLVDWERQRDMVNLNVVALMHLTHLFLPDMKAQKCGKILNVASVAAFQPGPLMSVYYASKAFVLSFSEALARELKRSGVTVTALCPGPVLTGWASAAQLGDSGLFKKLKPSTPQKVAAFGYKKMKKGKVVTVHKASNRFLIFSVRLAPRGFVRNIVYNIMKEKK